MSIGNVIAQRIAHERKLLENFMGDLCQVGVSRTVSSGEAELWGEFPLRSTINVNQVDPFRWLVSQFGQILAASH